MCATNGLLVNPATVLVSVTLSALAAVNPAPVFRPRSLFSVAPTTTRSGVVPSPCATHKVLILGTVGVVLKPCITAGLLIDAGALSQ